MDRLQEILARQEAVQNELAAIRDMSDPDGDEAQRAATLADRGSVTDRLITEWNTLEEERKPLHEREAQRARIFATAQDIARTRPQMADVGAAGGRNDLSVHSRGGKLQDPYKDLENQAVRSVSINEVVTSETQARDFVSRAETLIERAHAPHLNDNHREHMTQTLQRSSTKQAPLIAAHMLLTGREEYLNNFWQYVHAPMDNIQRAALALASANGGYLIPFTLDPTIILTNTGSANPFRQVSNVKTTATNNWNGVASTGMNAAFLAEAGIVTDNSPTFSNIQITPERASAWVFGSYEVLEDSDFETELPTLLADAKDRLEEANFATGAGHGSNVPKGIITAATTLYTTADTTGHTIAIADVYGIQAALTPRFRRNAVWVASISAINRFRQLDTAGGSSYWTNLGQGQPERLLGGGIYESTTIAAYTGAGAGQSVAVYGDFSQFAIVDRIGMSVMYEPMIKDITTQRPTGQGGWFAFWRVSSDALVPGAFRVLKTG